MKIIFCLPGNNFSGTFLQCWTNLISELPSNGIVYGLSQQSSCNIYSVRTKCLGASLDRGVDQKPFNGAHDYDYIMWIDSDIVFSPKQFFDLLESCGEDKSIVSGLYKMEDGKHFATVEHMDNEFFCKNAYYDFLTSKTLKKKRKLFRVDYTGMGWMLVKRGVVEAMEYPWFAPRVVEYDNGWREMMWDDVEFCTRARENGLDIWVNPKIVVGHEKKIVL